MKLLKKKGLESQYKFLGKMAILFFLNTSNYREPSQRQQWSNGKTGQELCETKNVLWNSTQHTHKIVTS